MLSAYSWSQFGLFALVLIILYYLVVGLLYYRAELTALLSSGRKGVSGQLAGAGGSAVAPPPLVRPTSAFVKATPAATEARDDAEDDPERPEAGADQNLPTAAEPLVGGALPDSTGTATGQDASTSDTVPMEATAGAGDEAQVQDENRIEEADQADEHLAALVRREARNQPTESVAADAASAGALEPETVQQTVLVDGYEPLASFDEPVASRLDIAPVNQPTLVAAASVAEYLTLLQTGQQPALPVELAGTTLAEQMAQQMSLNHAELDDLFGPDDE